jgi:hypothetical protein
MILRLTFRQREDCRLVKNILTFTFIIDVLSESREIEAVYIL